MGDEGMVKIELEAAEALAGLARCKDDANNNYSYEEEKSGVKDEQSTKLRLNGRRSRQNLTEAEIEARKIRRVLANRESARQTIRRRQDKDTALKQYDSLKTKNECLKAQMPKNEETREESSTSSTNSPFIIYKQPSFLPFVWPTSAGIVFPSRSSSCDSSGTPLYLLPYPWLLTLPQQHKQNHHPHSFNLNDKPKESSEPEKSTETHGGGGGGLQPTDSVVGGAETHQVPGKRSADTAAASEARKRRKQLTRLKNHFNCRQLRMH
ncbi:uncharacterized protein LOC110908360 isoform X4 [Helianthus annuus]|uniref:uncharacterized protein LOC110908360 isoform X4 n=1 Tax=Helianthus annuus TaxID=4232 RepID=UPI001652D79B|nr:uncharacterized protein LOC110908360 isoform X4 [Helianthus annuus]